MLIQLCYCLIAYYLLVATVGNLSDLYCLSLQAFWYYTDTSTQNCARTRNCVLPALRLLFHTGTKNYDPGWPIFQKFWSGGTKISVWSYCMEKTLLVGVALWCAVNFCSGVGGVWEWGWVSVTHSSVFRVTWTGLWQWEGGCLDSSLSCMAEPETIILALYPVLHHLQSLIASSIK